MKNKRKTVDYGIEFHARVKVIIRQKTVLIVKWNIL